MLSGRKLDVSAENGVLGVAIGAAGGQSKDFGFTGVGIYNSINDHTTARVGGNATVKLTGDAAIAATDTSTLITVAGTITRAEKVGIGASVGWNEISRATHAYLGQRRRRDRPRGDRVVPGGQPGHRRHEPGLRRFVRGGRGLREEQRRRAGRPADGRRRRGRPGPQHAERFDARLRQPGQRDHGGRRHARRHRQHDRRGVLDRRRRGARQHQQRRPGRRGIGQRPEERHRGVHQGQQHGQQPERPGRRPQRPVRRQDQPGCDRLERWPSPRPGRCSVAWSTGSQDTTTRSVSIGVSISLNIIGGDPRRSYRASA